MNVRIPGAGSLLCWSTKWIGTLPHVKHLWSRMAFVSGLIFSRVNDVPCGKRQMPPSLIEPERLIEPPALTPSMDGPVKDGEMVMGWF